MQLTAGDAQQHCKTDPRNFQPAKPEDEKLKSVYEIGRNSTQFSWVLLSRKIGLRLSCLKLNLSSFLPPHSLCCRPFWSCSKWSKAPAFSCYTTLIHCKFRSWGKVIYHHRTKDNIHYIGRGNFRSGIFLHLSIELCNLMFFTTDAFYVVLNVFKH